MRVIIFASFLLFLLVACHENVKTAKDIQMYDASGDMIGTAKLSEQPEGIKIKLELEGLTPGFHGIHVHEYGKCEGPDFKSSGNHFDPEGNKHGLMHPEGAHLGDLPNISADENGEVHAELMLDDATLLSGKHSLVEDEGTSLIISKEQDDGISQPGGDAGERIACGIISDEKEITEEPTDPTNIENEENEEESS